MRRLISKLFWWAIEPQAIELAIQSRSIRENLAKATVGKNSKFYPETRVVSRMEDKLRIRIGENTHARCNFFVFPFGGQIEIGDFTFIGEGSRIWSGDNITIGNHVMIAHNVDVMDTNSHEIDHLERAESFKQLLKTGHPRTQGSIKCAPVVIEDYAWIGFGSAILKGVTIGKGAIVGAHSLVTENVEPFTIVTGNPAKVTGRINQE